MTPASWVATRPTIDLDAAAAALSRHWGLDGELSNLPSERDRNLLLRPSDGSPPLVLKIANLVEDPAFLAYQTLAMERLVDAGLPVARACPALDGRTVVDLGDPGPPLARVVSWLPGRPLATVDRPSDALLGDLGEVMGRTSAALAGFDHPAAHRDLQWDVRRAFDTIAAGLVDIDDHDRRTRLETLLVGLRERLGPVMETLRTSVIHNDANDHNILVDDAGAHVVGLLDFGDLVHTVTAQEPAVAIAYATLGREDPVGVFGPLLSAYDRSVPLTDAELDAMPDLVLARLGMSVAISAHQGRLDPDPYLRVSEAPAWTSIEQLQTAGVERLRAAVHDAVGR